MIVNRPKFTEMRIGEAKEDRFDALSEYYIAGDDGATIPRWVVEPKMDGIWGAMIIRDGEALDEKPQWEIWSRTGKLKATGDAPPEMIGRRSMCILGEFMHGSHWGKARNLDGKFYAFDMVMYDGDWDFSHKDLVERREMLEIQLNYADGGRADSTIFPEFVELNQQWEVKDMMDVWDNLVKKQGYEGLILKRNDEAYMDASWVKIKAQADIDYVCMGFGKGHEGTKYEDTVGSIHGGLYNTDRELVDVCHVGGLTEVQRDFFNKHQSYFKGKVFTAHGYNIFPSGAIRHAKFKHFRTDKEGHECGWSQVEAGDWDSGIKE